MKIHCIDPGNGALRSAEINGDELTAEQLTTLANLCPVYRDDRWVLPETLYTMRGPKVTALLAIVTGCDKGPGTPGTADVRWLEARELTDPAGSPFIHRSADILPIGINITPKAIAERIG